VTQAATSAAVFKSKAREALSDPALQQAMDRAKGGFVGARRIAVEDLAEFDSLRDTARDIKDHVLNHLDLYLERYERKTIENGGHVHWAQTAEEACQIVKKICLDADARLVAKGKSMVSEEMELNRVLEEAGIEVAETDLGEYIIQLAGESPSHIIAPAIHKTREQITELFYENHKSHGFSERVTRREAIVNEARAVLRSVFARADVGITGANFLIAESGANVIVTNEGNGDLSSTLPREGEVEGPTEYHVVLLDNGRSAMLAGRYQSMLRCIRCGACLNHCPVYSAVGGHAYGWVYPGPMGSVLTPLMQGFDRSYDLPNACTLNGRCNEVCPVRIPLSDMLRKHRFEQYRRNLNPWLGRRLLSLWAWFARRPRLYQGIVALPVWLMNRFGRGQGVLRRLPGAGGWTGSRDMAVPEKRTFQVQWQAKRDNGK